MTEIIGKENEVPLYVHCYVFWHVSTFAGPLTHTSVRPLKLSFLMSSYALRKVLQEHIYNPIYIKHFS